MSTIQTPIELLTYNRITWTQYLHELFLASVEELGGAFHTRTSPKTIRTLMIRKDNSTDYITLAHLKSHLQSHRSFLRTATLDLITKDLLSEERTTQPAAQSRLDKYNRNSPTFQNSVDNPQKLFLSPALVSEPIQSPELPTLEEILKQPTLNFKPITISTLELKKLNFKLQKEKRINEL